MTSTRVLPRSSPSDRSKVTGLTGEMGIVVEVRLGCAVPNRVPVSRCSGFEFRINYGGVVFVARRLNCNFCQSFTTIVSV